MLAKIIASPDDDRPRIKYANWLTAQDNPRGEFIQIQCQLAQLRSNPKLNAKEKAQRDRLTKGEQSLLEKYFEIWTRPLAASKINKGQTVFERGFLFKLALRSIDVTNESLERSNSYPNWKNWT